MPEIFTIGHSNHAGEEFAARLTDAGVELLADVRRHPGSRRVPWTNSEELQSLLATRSIGYLHLPDLGGRRRPVAGSPNGAWENAQFQGYADHMASPEFARGLAELEARARRRRTALMCAEGQWWRCHRRLLSDILLVRGWSVEHLALRGKSQQHELTPFAVVEGERVKYPSPQAEIPGT